MKHHIIYSSFLKILCLFLAFNTYSIQGQDTKIELARDSGETHLVVTDIDNNSYEIHTSSVDLNKYDPTLAQLVPVYTMGNQNQGGIAIHKLDQAGNLLWTKIIGQTGDLFVRTIKYDLNGYFYIHGYCQGIVDFDPTAAIAYTGAYGWYDTFVAKYDTDGNFVWVKSVGTITADYAGWIDIELDGSVSLVGNFYGTIDLDPTNVDDLHGSYSTGSSSYLLRLDKDGNYESARTFNFHVDQKMVQPNGDLVMLVKTNEPADFDPSDEVATFDAGKYLVKMTRNGNFKYAYFSESYTKITIDNRGYIYGIGAALKNEDLDVTSAKLSFDAPYSFNFLAKMDPNMKLLWVKQFDTDLDELFVDQRGNIILSGMWHDQDDFDPGPNVVRPAKFKLRGHGIFLLQLDATGNFVEVTTLEEKNDYSHPLDLYADAQGTIYWSGSLSGINNTLYLDLFHPYLNDLSNTSFMLKLNNKAYDLGKRFTRSNVVIYPNPCVDYLFLEVRDFKERNVTIYNNIGQLIYTKKLTSIVTTLDLQDYPKGVYNLVTWYNDKPETIKIVKN